MILTYGNYHIIGLNTVVEWDIPTYLCPQFNILLPQSLEYGIIIQESTEYKITTTQYGG